MKISVIVPVYNVEKYLTRCIDSIVAQSYPDLEIILVNDGSTDSSPQICEDFRRKDARIQVIHQPNGGVSEARNKGISASTGDYITFVDSDDWLAKDMYQKMSEILRSHTQTDVIMCDFVTVKNNSEQKISTELREGLYTKKDIIGDIYPTLLVTEDFGRLPIVSIWNCFFKKSLFENQKIQFDKSLSYSEDYLFMADVMTHCNSYYYAKNLYGYYYRQYDESRSKKYQPEWWETLLVLNLKLKNLLSGSGEYDFSRQLKLQLIHSALFVSSSIHTNKNLRFTEKITRLNSIIDEHALKAAFSALKFKTLSVSMRMVLFFIKHRMPLAYLLYLNVLSKIKAVNSK